MFILKDVNKIYKLKKGKVNSNSNDNSKNNHDHQALKNVNLELPDKGFYSILGRSGSGKTTLLNCFAGIDRVTSGAIYYNGVDITKLKGNQLDNYRSEIAFIFQEYNLLSEYTVKENIALSIKLQGKKEEEIDNIVKKVLKDVGLEGYENRKIIELSGGQQQRVVVARALARDVKVIFCDEPTGNLDNTTSIEIFNLLKEVAKDSLVVLVTHNKNLALEYSDGIVEISKGEVISNSIKKFRKDAIFPKKYIKKNENLFFHFQLCLEQIKSLKVIAIMVLLLFISSLTVFTVFSSISSFSATDAIVSTLKDNDQTVVQLMKYSEYVKEIVDDFGKNYFYGLSIDASVPNETEFKELKEKVNNQATIYESYYFIKPFDTFSNVTYPYSIGLTGEDNTFHFHAFCFEEMIAVDDFSNFSMPLLFGSNPKEDNEILIYDYMADSLIYHQVFTCSMEELIGKTINDKTQNLNYKIAGIIKSNYQKYAYLDGVTDDEIMIGKEYLESLKAIFVNKSLVNKLKTNVQSINGLVWLVKDDNGFSKRSIDGFKTLECVNGDYEYIYEKEIGYGKKYTYGLVLTRTQVQKVMGLDHSVTNEEIDEFINQFEEKNTQWCFQIQAYGISSSGQNPNTTGVFSRKENYSYLDIIGVVEDNTFNDNETLHYYCEDYLKTDKHQYERLYLSLNKNYKNAEEVISYFEYPNHDDAYFENCIKNRNFYEAEGYCVYDFASIAIVDGAKYFHQASSIAKGASLICYGLIVLGIAGFCFFSIKKQSYKIGILKSLGTRNYQIGLSFVMSILIISILAYVISIPISFIAMNRINNYFVNETYGINLIIYNVSISGLLFSLGNLILISVIASFVIYLSFTINPPIMLIRYNKEK